MPFRIFGIVQCALQFPPIGIAIFALPPTTQIEYRNAADEKFVNRMLEKLSILEKIKLKTDQLFIR